RPAPQAARDDAAAGASGGVHLRDRLAARRRPAARAPRGRLRRLVERDPVDRRPADARPERRHPRLEPRHAAPPRAEVRRHPGRRGVPPLPARAVRPAGARGAAVPPGDPRRRAPTLDRRWHRTVADDDAAPAQGAPRRGERVGLAAEPEGSLRRPEHPRARLGEVELRDDSVRVGETELRLRRPASPDALIDEEAFATDEFLPYWAELWPAALALADALPEVAGLRVCELGCGLGLPSLVAAARGADVTATDW